MLCSSINVLMRQNTLSRFESHLGHQIIRIIIRPRSGGKAACHVSQLDSRDEGS